METENYPKTFRYHISCGFPSCVRCCLIMFPCRCHHNLASIFNQTRMISLQQNGQNTCRSPSLYISPMPWNINKKSINKCHMKKDFHQNDNLNFKNPRFSFWLNQWTILLIVDFRGQICTSLQADFFYSHINLTWIINVIVTGNPVLTMN